MKPSTFNDTEEFSGDYRGWLYPRMRRSKAADPAFLAIEPALQHRDWKEVKKLLKWIADCLGVPSVLHPQMSIDIVQKIVKYPFNELRVESGESRSILLTGTNCGFGLTLL